jgi:hypothetical protein
MLDRFGPGEFPGFGDMPDEQDWDLLGAGELAQLERRLADLIGRAQARAPVGQDRLDGIDDHGGGRRLADVVADRREVLLMDDEDGGIFDLQPLRAQLDLAGGLLPRDVEHGGVLSQARRELQRERRLPDPRLPSH